MRCRCLAALQMHNSTVYARLEEAVMSWAPEDFRPGPRADVLWAFARAGYHPGASLLAGFAEVCTPGLKLWVFEV